MFYLLIALTELIIVAYVLKWETTQMKKIKFNSFPGLGTRLQ